MNCEVIVSKPAKNADVGRPRGESNLLAEGDIVVTPVARHFVISRMRADGKPHEYLGLGANRAVALKAACSLAGAEHHVFLYANGSTSDHARFDCR